MEQFYAWLGRCKSAQIRLNDVPLGSLPNEFAGVHESAVPSANLALFFQKPIRRMIPTAPNWVQMGVLMDACCADTCTTHAEARERRSQQPN